MFRVHKLWLSASGRRRRVVVRNLLQHQLKLLVQFVELLQHFVLSGVQLANELVLAVRRRGLICLG